MPEDDGGLTLLRKINAQIRYYFKCDPDEMDDMAWARSWHDLIWIRTIEKNISS